MCKCYLYCSKYIQFKVCLVNNFGDLPTMSDVGDVGDVCNDEQEIDNILQFDLPDELPQSGIVKEFENKMILDDEYNAFVIASKSIYDKYIAPHKAPYEINLSYKSRKLLVNLFGNDNLEVIFKNIEIGANENDNNGGKAKKQIMRQISTMNNKLKQSIDVIIPLLDDALKQVTSLMVDSFYRFQHTQIARDLYRQNMSKSTSNDTISNE